VYQAVVNYLQFLRWGAGQYYEFDMGDFKKFKLESHTALYSLKAWSRRQVHLTSRYLFPQQFNSQQRSLPVRFENNLRLEPLIKALLRAYEGIFDHPSLYLNCPSRNY
jgi:ATP-dependent DNA helicase RecQ